MEKQSTAGFWLSPSQKYAWSLQPDAAGTPFRAATLVLIEGPLEQERLLQALREVVSRHEILRTIFHRQPGMKVPFQVVLDSGEPCWETIVLGSLDENAQQRSVEDLFRREQTRNLNLENDLVLQATVAKLDRERFVLALSLPIVCGDARSLQNIAREVGLVYAGRQAQLDQEPLRYVQFAQWQNDLLESSDENAQNGKGFWNQQQNFNLPALTFAQEIKQDAKANFCPDAIEIAVDLSLLNSIEAASETYGAGTSHILMAAWQLLLSRLTGQANFAMGVYVDGREYEELERAVGLFAKMLPIPVKFDGDFRFREILTQVRDSIHRAIEWQEYFVPPGDAAGEQIAFAYSELPGEQAYGDVTFRFVRQYVCCDRFKLKLSAQRRESGLTLEFHYNATRLERKSVERLAGYFQTLLAAAMDNPEVAVSRLPLLNEAERHQLLVEWNQTAAPYPEGQCLQQLFEAQAARTPDRPALQGEDRQLSYCELNQQANQLAHYLRRLGVGPDSLVGLCVERSAEMVVALLGILKAGGAYVALSPDNPKARLAQQLSGVVVLITELKLVSQMPEFAGKTLFLDGDQDLWAQEPQTDPAVRTTPENLAYVLYTSGSTGVPKGVAVRHGNLVNYAHFITQRLELGKYPDGLHFATVSTMSADLGNTCIYPALISGGCLHVMAYEVSTDSQRFARYTEQHPIDVLKIVPSHLQALINSSEGKKVLPRKYLILGGETLTPNLLQKIQDLGAPCEVFNHYGPTETTVGSLTLGLKEYDWKNSQAASIPIGRPIANTQIYILDSCQQPVPIGVAGELYIAGAGVTAGYLKQPEGTAECFLPNPFVNDSAAAGSRMYRTGDRARYLPDGNVEFLGRGDEQVKIRGFRIELREIESILAKHAAVKQAVVLAREDERGDKRLVAYVVAHREPSANPDELRTYLKEQLPDYMVPVAIVHLPKLPLTSNGKIDRQGLPAPEAARSQTKTYVAPRTPTEEVVANIWAEVLHRERISTEDNFFDLGGHSLTATQIVSRVREHFHVEIAMRILFEKPTISRLAEAIDGAQQSGREIAEPAIVPVSRVRYIVTSQASTSVDFQGECDLTPQASCEGGGLSQFNDAAADYPRHLCVHQLFEAQAQRTPSATAVEFRGASLTYAELNARSNQLAHLLRKHGVQREVLVGLCVDRSLEMVVALLGILKAGGAYVPIDPAYPRDRTQYVLDDAHVKVLLTQESLLKSLPTTRAEAICLDSQWNFLAGESSESLAAEVGPENLAYVIYTSGSTGKPKGVQLEHRSVVNLLCSMQREPGLTADDVLVAVTTLSFDIAGLEMYLPLLAGARLVVAKHEQTYDGRRLMELLEQSGATVMQATPATWRLLFESGWKGNPQLKILVGGEALPAELARQLVSCCGQVWNMYGPTETTIWSSIYRVEGREERIIPIGKPIANTTFYILGGNGQPVGPGAEGELYIGGEGLARGYFERPELTEEKFVPDPFGRGPGARMYRTGDLARYRADGNVEFLGRIDHQVKIRGFRVELGEIEAVLEQHANVQRAIVVAREHVPGEKHLVAYLVPEPDRILTSAELRSHVRRQLPDYMTPAAFVELRTLPLMPNGKVDRNALPAPKAADFIAASDDYVASRDSIEQQLTGLWEEVLGIHPIGVTANFFDLGGTSILAAKLFTKILETFHRDLPLALLFQSATIAQLANELRPQSSAVSYSTVVAVQPGGSKPPFFCVHGGLGSTLFLRPLARLLGPEQPFYAIEPEGLDGHRFEQTTIEEMARHYVAEMRKVQPEGPYYIGGYCFGGIVAFEMARQLRHQGERPGAVALISAALTYHRASLSTDKLRELKKPANRFLRVLRSPKKALNWRVTSLRRTIRRGFNTAMELNICRFFFLLGRKLPPSLREMYIARMLDEAERKFAPKYYPGTLLLFRGGELYDDRPNMGWDGLADGFESFEIGERSRFRRDIIDNPLVDLLAKQLALCLEKSQAGRQGSATDLVPEQPAIPANGNHLLTKVL